MPEGAAAQLVLSCGERSRASSGASGSPLGLFPAERAWRAPASMASKAVAAARFFLSSRRLCRATPLRRTSPSRTVTRGTRAPRSPARRWNSAPRAASAAPARASEVATRAATSLRISPRSSAVISFTREVSSTRSSASISPTRRAKPAPRAVRTSSPPPDSDIAPGEVTPLAASATPGDVTWPANFFSARSMVAAAAFATSSAR
mmetsp:Transcript_100452/g.224388  ORF Transcript_100452/g.224388 Transcript_100452/m.224388 type:complete len:205 (-) Transcript_100452:292-906(-)